MTVTLPYVPVDGDLIDVDGLNENWASTTDGASLYGEWNGGIEADNLSAKFRVCPELIRPRTLCRGAQESATETLDYFDDGFSIEPDDDDPEALNEYVTLSGVVARRYFTHDVTAAIYGCSLFYTVFRLRETTDDSLTPPGGRGIFAEDITLRVFIDDEDVSYAVRECPGTAYWNGPPPPLGDPDVLVKENFQTQHLCLDHLAIANGDDPERCAKGWHEISVRVRIPHPLVTVGTTPPNSGGGAAGPWDTTVFHRFRVGVRSVRILPWL